MRNKTKKITDRTFDYEKITGILTGGGSPSAICRSLRDFHSGQLAASLPHMTTETRRILYKAADAQMLAQMLERCDDAEIFTGEMDLVKAARTMEKIEPDKAADILRALPAGKRKAIIELMGEPKKSSINPTVHRMLWAPFLFFCFGVWLSLFFDGDMALQLFYEDTTKKLFSAADVRFFIGQRG